MRFLLFALALVVAGAPPALADTIVTRNGSQTGAITKVTKDAITIKTGEAELTISRKDIVRVEAGEPKEVKQARAAVKAGNHSDAIELLRPVAERLTGLGVAWVPESLLLLADAGIQTRDLALAKKTIESLQADYPTWLAEGAAEARLARIQCEQKQCEPAIAAANGVVAKLLKKEFLNGGEEQAIAEAYLVLGDCQSAAEQKEAALDSYLRVVTLFDLDAARAGQAQFKAAKLYEAANNWKRAQAGYREALERTPAAGWAPEAKKRLKAIEQAHPE